LGLKVGIYALKMCYESRGNLIQRFEITIILKQIGPSFNIFEINYTISLTLFIIIELR